MKEKIKNLMVEERKDNSIYGCSEYAVIKLSNQGYCSSCGRDLKDIELCFWAPLDNTIICQDKKCTSMHAELEPRLFLRR